MSDRTRANIALALVVLLGVANGGALQGCDLPSIPSIVAPSVEVTAAPYIYEKDRGTPPAPVLAALNRLNRERGIKATAIDKHVTDGTGDTPEQYKAAVAAAKANGLPALVVMAGNEVVKVVSDPRTEEAVMEAVP